MNYEYCEQVDMQILQKSGYAQAINHLDSNSF